MVVFSVSNVRSMRLLRTMIVHEMVPIKYIAELSDHSFYNIVDGVPSISRNAASGKAFLNLPLEAFFGWMQAEDGFYLCELVVVDLQSVCGFSQFI